MAKFAKTTEVDISSMHDVMEEEIPKKNKWGIIIPIVLSVIIAFGIWIYATEVNSDTHSKTFDVSVTDASGISIESVEVEVIGTYSQLADVKSEYIIVTKTGGKYSDPELTKDAFTKIGKVSLTIVD
ncbi:MAG: hypothetical protein IJ437_01160 [Clostridia bacterium]|nr:hypothetical protein [Clostridia bacterium]